MTHFPLLHDIHTLIFDYGGTLDTGGQHWAHVLWQAYVTTGVPISEEQFREAYVHAERTLGRERIIMPEDNFLALLTKKVHLQANYLTAHHYWHLAPPQQAIYEANIAQYCYEVAKGFVTRAGQVLRTLQSTYPLILVSNFYGNIHTILQDFNLDIFDHVIESAVVGVRKPNPAIFALGVSAAGVASERTVVIGDSLDKDILPAQSLGCQTIWLKGKGWTTAEDNQSAEGITITQLEDILPLLMPLSSPLT